MIEKARYDWQRWWLPVGRVPMLDEFGMFYDPAGPYGKYLNPSAKPLSALDNVGCLLLLGESGIGKTTELKREVRRLRSLSAPVVKFDLGGYSDLMDLKHDLTTDTERALSEAGNRRVVLVLDGLDEAALGIPRLIDAISRWLGTMDRPRVGLRLASRPVAGGLARLSASLRGLWPGGVAEYRLAPLTHTDVERAAENHGLGGQMFVDRVEALGIGVLAARPITLKLILSGASDGSRLPDTRHEVYEKGIRALAEEWDKRRRESKSPKVPVGDVVAAAERLATVSVLSGRSRIVQRSGSDTQPDSVSLDDDPSLRTRLSNADAVWESGLLDHDEYGYASFIHRSVAEFLAARYLMGLDFKAQRRLLADPNDRELVTPQLRAVAEWLSYESTDVLTWLRNTDVYALLNPDLASRPEEQRRKIGRALLDRLDQEQAVTGWQSYDGLAYDGLDNDLRPRLSPDRPSWVRREAITIAWLSKAAGLDAELLGIIANAAQSSSVGDYNAEVQLGTYAIHALAASGGPDAQRQVVDLAFNTSISTYLRLAALPTTIETFATRELCARLDLTVPGNSDPEFMGELYNELYRALRESDSHDPRVLIHWLHEHVRNSGDLHHLVQLTSVVFRYALHRHNHLDDHTWGRLGTLYTYVVDRPGSSSVIDIDLSDRPAARRMLAVEVLKGYRNPQYAVRQLVMDKLIVDDDLEYWLEHYATALEAETSDVQVAEKVIRAISSPTTEHQQIANEVALCHPILRPFVRDRFSPQAIDQHTAHLEEEQQRQADRQADELFSPNRLSTALGIEDWLAVRSELERNVAGADPAGVIRDKPISHLPAWKDLDRTRRSGVVSCAQKFLTESTCREVDWVQEDAAGAAVALLADLDPGLLTQLTTDSLTFWTPIITRAPRWFDTSSGLLAIVADTNPEWAEDFVITQLRQEACDPFSRIIRQMGTLTSDGIVDTLAELVESEETNPRGTLAMFLAVGLELDPTRFVRLCRTLIRARPCEKPDAAPTDDDSPEALTWSRAVTAAYALACSTQIVDQFDHLLDAFTSSTDFAADVVRRRRMQATQIPFVRAKPMQRARLFLWARDTFPKNEWEAPGQVYTIDNTEELARELFTNLTGLADQENLEALRHIANETGDPWHRAAVRDMRRANRQRIWEAPLPTAVGEVLDNASRRIVSTEAQLHELLVDKIRDVGDTITKDATLRSMFWHRQHGRKKTYIPCLEPEFSDRFRLLLQRELQGVIIKREVLLQPGLGSQSGQEADIDVSLVDDNQTVITCLVEVKCNWNDEIETALDKQLAERYLHGPYGTHGVYLVAWYGGENWLTNDRKRSKAGSRDKNELLETFRRRAVGLEDQGITVTVCLIDLTLEQSSRKTKH